MTWRPWYLPDRDINDRILKARAIREQAKQLLTKLEAAIMMTEEALGGEDDILRGRGETPTG